MRIAYLINQYPKVSHTFIRREIAALEEQGIEIERFSIRNTRDGTVDQDDKLEAERTRSILSLGTIRLLAHGGRVAATRPIRLLKALALTFRLGLRSDRGLFRHCCYLLEACVLFTWLQRAGVEHIHTHFGTNGPVVAMLCRALGGPSHSFTVHGPTEFDKPERLALDKKAKSASFIVAVSEFGRSQLYRWCEREDWPKIAVVHCGIDGDFLDSPPRPIPTATKLVCVGRLCEQKGHFVLLQAASRLAGEGIDFELVLVGDGPLRHDIEAAARELGIRERVAITGWATNQEVREQLLASRALVLPSFAEGLPVVIMEAFALGRPVISTHIAGIPELVTPGECGWLVPAGSVDALADAMREVLEAPVERLELMGRAGTERVRKFHDVRREVAKLAELFRASIDGTPLRN